MLNAFVITPDEAAVPVGLDTQPGVEDRRAADRRRLPGAELYLFLVGDQRFRLKVRDLGATGVCGLTDAPLQTGELLIVQLEELLMPAARVVWTLRTMAGFRFNSAIPLTRLQHIRQRHAAGAAWSPAMRAGSDLHAWWTDVEAHSSGRRATRVSKGRMRPLAR